MRRLTLPLLMLLSLPLTGCQLGARLEEHVARFLPPANSRLVLKQALTIPAHTAHVNLQGGRVVSGSDIKQYYPYCRLEVNKVLESEQNIDPDEFLIRRAYNESQTAHAGGLQRAAHRVRVTSGGRLYLVYRTIFVLASNRQPGVRWMTCEHWAEAATGQYLTLEEIRNALGDVFALAAPAAGKSGT
jgi:hypothetical protein